MMENSPLFGKHILFLGSSVTCGAAAEGVSFADFLAERCGCIVTREAVSGTTLVDNGPDSYIARMKRMDPEAPADLFVCQLSTNDATRGLPLGKVSDADSHDTSTVAGAIGEVIDYAGATWNCPVAFYTNPKYDSDTYAAMVELMHAIAEKKNVAVIDLWNDAAFNAITDSERRAYMADAIHPTRAGYLQWWTPYLEHALADILCK